MPLESDLLLSPEDEDLRQFPYNFTGGYARLGTTKFGYTMIHRIVAQRMGLTSNIKHPLDHINRNKLDNRRENLRVVSARENVINSDRQDNAAGVHFHKREKIWHAYISFNRKTTFLGQFETREEAKAVYEASKIAGKPLPKSKVKGCCFHALSGKWRAYLARKGVRMNLGYFSTESEAHAAYLEAKEKCRAGTI